jgi:hypothetical protein
MRHILLIPVIAALAGCGSELVPRVVVEGTTAMIAIPMEFEVGYGRRLSGPGIDPEVSPTLAYASVGPEASLEDLQRGELVFTLYRTTGEKVTVLRLSYITRVAQDPSSRRAQGTLQFHEDNFQPVAFVDIPTGIVPDAAGQDEFEIAVTRWRRSSANVDTFERVEQGYDPQWVGWGNHTAVPSISQRIPITIVDAPEAAGMEVPHYSPKYAWGPFMGGIDKTYAEADLRDAVPQPEFRVQVPDAASPPHAWNLSIDFPAERIEIEAVRLIRANPSGGYVGWSATPSPTSDCTAPVPGTLDVHVADPDQLSRGIAVAFRFTNQGQADCRQKVTVGELDVDLESYRGYGASGLPVAQNDFQIIPFDLQ